MPADTRIPMLHAGFRDTALLEEVQAAVAEVIANGRYVLGEALQRFEARVAARIGMRHAIGVASGTDALTLALHAAGVGERHEVITTPFSFWATVEAIHRVDARAVFVDVQDADMNIDPEGIEAAITPATRAIMPVHIFGQAANMPAINLIAERHGLAVIEDAAQAFGAKLHGKPCGSFGFAGCFSFHPAKPLGAAGDGGMIVTNDDAVAGRLQRLRNHGTRAHHVHTEFGYNSRLDTLQAAILDVKLKYLDDHLQERRRLAAIYDELLRDAGIRLPSVLPGREHVFAQYTVRASNREQIARALADANIESAVHYGMPLYRQSPLANAPGGAGLPVVETVCRQCLSLPVFAGLREDEQARVASAVLQARELG